MTRTELAHKIAETIFGKTFSGTAAERQKQLVSAILSLLPDDEVVPHKQTETADTPAPAQIICHEGRKFERTGEVRPPRYDEWFLIVGSQIPMRCSRDYSNPEAVREILCEIPDEFEKLAESPAAPLAPRCPRCGSAKVGIVDSKSDGGVNVIRCADCNRQWKRSGLYELSQFFSPAPTSPQGLAGRIADRLTGWHLDEDAEEINSGIGQTWRKEVADIIEQELKR